MFDRLFSRPCLWAAALLCALAFALNARAGGHTGVVDDSEVEAPGLCHIESWATDLSSGSGYTVVSPACTRTAWPRLELGGSLQYFSDGRGLDTFGPAAKLNLRRADDGVGVAVTVSGSWGLRGGRLENAAAIVPLTCPLTDRLSINFNAGWSYVRGDRAPGAALGGAQVDARLTNHIGFMAEVFRRDHGRPGQQFGVHWAPGGGKVDLALLIGNRVEGESPTAVSLGLILHP